MSRGPTQPVCEAESPCTAPAPGVSLTFVSGSVSRHVETGARGTYSMRLAPGRYTVRVAGARFGYSPRSVTVSPGRMSTADIVIDTGIR